MLFQIPQEVRREPQADDRNDRRLEITDAQASDEAPRSARGHDVKPSVSPGSDRLQPRIAPERAPVTVQKTTPSCVLKTGPAKQRPTIASWNDRTLAERYRSESVEWLTADTYASRPADARAPP